METTNRKGKQTPQVRGNRDLIKRCRYKQATAMFLAVTEARSIEGESGNKT